MGMLRILIVEEVKLGNVLGTLQPTIVREDVRILPVVLLLLLPLKLNVRLFHQNVLSTKVGIVVKVLKQIVHRIVLNQIVHIVFKGNANGV